MIGSFFPGRQGESGGRPGKAPATAACEAAAGCEPAPRTNFGHAGWTSVVRRYRVRLIFSWK